MQLKQALIKLYNCNNCTIFTKVFYLETYMILQSKCLSTTLLYFLV